jgi:hypothetical protein
MSPRSSSGSRRWMSARPRSARPTTRWKARVRTPGLSAVQVNCSPTTRSATVHTVGGECAGRSPVDRAKGGLKRSQLADGSGVPIAARPAPANIRDHTLLPAALDLLSDLLAQVGAAPEETTVHLDAGYDYRPCRAELAERGLSAAISQRGQPAPVQVGKRWVIERANSWLNDFGRLRRCTERRRVCVEAYLALAAAIVTLRALLRAAWFRFRWEHRPRSPRIR